MIGAIIGDIVGSRFEFNNHRSMDFELFGDGCSYTDDTITTIAIADAILHGIPYKESLIKWCRKYNGRQVIYGFSFRNWIMSDNPQPYNSYGNGSAMRVSPIGFAFDNSVKIMEEAKKSAECSHSHEEGIKGAQSIAISIFGLANKIWENSKEGVENICKLYYGDDYLKRIPKKGQWDSTCQGCVPLSMHIFSNSNNFEDAIRKAISYGGDSDTIGAIVGSLAGAYYDIPKEIEDTAMSYLPSEMIRVIVDFKRRFPKNNKTHFSGNKDPLFTSLHDDPYMKWPDRRICHDCLNKLPLQGSECDVFENVVDVNNAINTGKCEFYIKKKQ
jgi:ADP-ribosylglycohydrolase